MLVRPMLLHHMSLVSFLLFCKNLVIREETKFKKLSLFFECPLARKEGESMYEYFNLRKGNFKNKYSRVIYNKREDKRKTTTDDRK